MSAKPIREILLIEDNPGDARLIREMFGDPDMCDLDLTHVACMAEAEAHLARDGADVVLLDLGLPDVLDRGAVRRVHAASPRLPVVVLTGLDDQSAAADALRDGAQDYLVKGQFDPRGLARSILYAVQRRLLDEALILEKEAAQRAQIAAEQANLAKSRFLAGMSHELRTPLAGILGYTQLLMLEGGLSAVQLSRVNAMLDAGSHLLEMISSVLDLSQIETGQMLLHQVAVDLRSVAATCLNLVRPAAEQKGLALGLEMAPDVSADVMTDPTRVRQILVNLLGNAVKFTRQGGVTMRILHAGEPAQLRFEVADTGPGISVVNRRFLYLDYERLDAEAGGATVGAGLGLALSARLAAAMGGSLAYEDNAGGGSVFCLQLPLIVPVSSSPRLSRPGLSSPGLASPDVSSPGVSGGIQRMTQAGAPPGRRLRALVVDDNAVNCDIADAFLCAAGHQVTCLSGGGEAVAAIAATDFDVVLMDVRMPGIDGLEATRRVRLLGGTRGQVPIVATTAQAFTDEVAACLEAGMNGHLAKPFTPAALLEAVLDAAGPGYPP